MLCNEDEGYPCYQPRVLDCLIKTSRLSKRGFQWTIMEKLLHLAGDNGGGVDNELMCYETDIRLFVNKSVAEWG